MKVYAVWSGCYSDATVEAIFDTEEAAQRLAKQIGDDNDGRVEEYELNARTEDEMGPVFMARVSVETGELTVDDYVSKYVRHPSRPVVSENYNRTQIWSQSPVSRDHAAKVAVEARQEWLRTHAQRVAQP